MAELSIPLQLSPVLKRKIWGRRDLSPIRSSPRSPDSGHAVSQPRDQAAESGRIGEMWLTDDASRFLNGPIAGLTLGEVAAQFGEELWGTGWKGCRFPILAKYIFSSDWLSVQVHPDDEQARRFDPGNTGKCEMWFIIAADARARIRLGLKKGASLNELKEACAQGASQGLLNQFAPSAGEAIYIPPGTVHAIGPGLVLFEVEENSDLTYRLDDYGRTGQDGKPRPLHLEKALAVTRLDAPARRNLPRIEWREPYGSRRFVMACPHFALEVLTFQKTAKFQAAASRVEVYSFLEGTGRIETAAGWLGYRTGETWIVPPGNFAYRFAPKGNGKALKFYVPDMGKDFCAPLRARGISKDLIAQVLFD